MNHAFVYMSGKIYIHEFGENSCMYIIYMILEKFEKLK